jgi:hypothetical protein
MAPLTAEAPRLQSLLKVGRTMSDLAGTEEIQLLTHSKTIQQTISPFQI